MKQILIPTDFSPIAHNAFRLGLKLANNFGSEVHLAHGFHLPKLNQYRPEELNQHLIDNEKSKALIVFEQFARNFPDQKGEFENSNTEINYHLQLGLGVEVVLDVAKEINPSLIIMGTKGSSFITNRFFGSISQQVVKKTDIPVLLIPQSFKDDSFDMISLLLNLSNYNIADIKNALSIAQAFKLKLSVQYFDKQTDTEQFDSIKNEIKATFPNEFKEGKGNIDRIQSNQIIKDFKAYQKDNPSQLCIIKKQKQSIWESLVATDYAKEITASIIAPILVI